MPLADSGEEFVAKATSVNGYKSLLGPGTQWARHKLFVG